MSGLTYMGKTIAIGRTLAGLRVLLKDFLSGRGYGHKQIRASADRIFVTFEDEKDVMAFGLRYGDVQQAFIDDFLEWERARGERREKHPL